MRVASRLLLFPTALLLACQLVVSAFGQAWVPPKGEGEMAISYQNLFTTEHFPYRQMNLYWRLKGLWRYWRGDTAWGELRRKDLSQPPDSSKSSTPETAQAAAR